MECFRVITRAVTPSNRANLEITMSKIITNEETKGGNWVKIVFVSSRPVTNKEREKIAFIASKPAMNECRI